jgi:hypothetical protein
MSAKFGEFYRNSLKFDGFGPHRISKSAISLFTDSKYFKKYKINSEQTSEDIFQK